ncbi:MAG: Ig-like domain-containing protein [Ignavibacteriales bacterium]|nr:Ig-like domain-containing protein [Ignavibacteriales bacterium]
MNRLTAQNLRKENFTIVDSTKNILYSVKSLYKGNPRKNEYVLGVLDSLNLENEFYLIAKNIYDKKQNKLVEESISFTPSDKVDTTAVKISKIIAPLTNNMIDYLSPTFSISFSDAFNKSDYNKGINFYDSDSNTIPIQLTLLDDASIEIKTEKDLKPKKTYKLSVNLNYFTDLTNNKLDTVIVNKINTISSNEFSGASGLVKTNYGNVKVVLKSIENKNKIEQRNINPDGKFEFERVMPGNYLLWTFEDSDSNNQYSFGSVDSNKFAEPFQFYPDTLDLRPRWPIGDIEIDFNK